MNIGIIASQNKGIGSTPEPQPLQANAGGDIVVSRFSPYTLLDGSASTGAITSYHWEELNLNGLLERIVFSVSILLIIFSRVAESP